MRNVSVSTIMLVISVPLQAGVDVSVEKDLVEIGAVANVNRNVYLSIGADTDEWIGIGLGYHRFVSKEWKLAGYYEYGMFNDWLLEEVVGVDGVKTKSHSIDLNATRYFDRYSTRFGLKTERVRNGFTWLTVDNADKYSSYLAASKLINNFYVSAKYEYHFAIDRSDMKDFNQGHASELEFSTGTLKPVWHVYPYVKLTSFIPHSTYYGMNSTDYGWTIGGRLSF